jgi:SAM-dependent methyltransferase
MAGGNEQQIADWNGVLGQRWAELQDKMDRMTAAFGQAALEAAGAMSGERVIDIGCGCGETTMALARAVGPGGEVLGVDVSRPMLDVARRRARDAALPGLDFAEGDASAAKLPDGRDLLYSRFGVMFFDTPVPAFAHMRRSLKDGGRIAFVCWQSAAENLWASVPLQAGRSVVHADMPPVNPHAPGPFAFADPNRLRGILLEADFDGVSIDSFEAPVFLGATPRKAAEDTARMGPLGRFVREAGEAHLPAILDAVEAALEPMAERSGKVFLPGRTWIVTARAD